jgi:hypothetical protein
MHLPGKGCICQGKDAFAGERIHLAGKGFIWRGKDSFARERMFNLDRNLNLCVLIIVVFKLKRSVKCNVFLL